MIRSPICTFMGHVDHGKTSILDSIRKTAIVKTEAGAITQAIGASIIPLNTIKEVCGQLLEQLKINLTIPGLLFIDTPGHAAFTNLRKRGGSLADIAILVIDINEGFMPQTEECIEILKHNKTPFIIAANKIDLISGWRDEQGPLLQVIPKQLPHIQEELDKKIYTLVGKLSELGFNSERFDRIEDYTKQIAIIPCSAKTGQGIAELLMVLTGLAQKYLEKSLQIEVKGPAKGTILEVKEEKGLGKTLDVIIYDGILKKNDLVVIGGLNKPIVTKVKALFEPMPLEEMRVKKAQFKPVDQVAAATGVKISATGIDEATAGMPIRVCSEQELDKVKEEIQNIVKEVLIATDKIGIIVKTDSLGSLEALITLLKEKHMPIRKATIGNITKKDIAEAEANYDKDPLQAVVLGFNVSLSKEIDTIPEKVKIITSDIIYRLIEEFELWQEQEKSKLEQEALAELTKPCKLEILRGYVFRQSNPAVIGVEVLAGTARTGISLMKQDGKSIGTIKSMQLEQENIAEAEKGKQVAIAIPEATVGRQINEGEILLSDISEEEFRKLKQFKKYLNKDEIEILKEIAEIKRKSNVIWGI